MRLSSIWAAGPWVLKSQSRRGEKTAQACAMVTTQITSKASIICPGYLIDSCSSKKRRPRRKRNPKQVGSTEREKTPAVSVAGTRAPSARAADSPHVAASPRSRPFGDQGGSHVSNLPLPGYFRRGGQREPIPPNRNSFRRSLFGSAWQLPDRLLRPPGGDLFRRRRGGHAALPKSGSSVAQA